MNNDKKKEEILKFKSIFEVFKKRFESGEKLNYNEFEGITKNTVLSLDQQKRVKKIFDLCVASAYPERGFLKILLIWFDNQSEEYLKQSESIIRGNFMRILNAKSLHSLIGCLESREISLISSEGKLIKKNQMDAIIDNIKSVKNSNNQAELFSLSKTIIPRCYNLRNIVGEFAHKKKVKTLSNLFGLFK
jgi:hypothetical protein